MIQTCEFSDSVNLIAEAGTGYNNIDLVALKEGGISVINFLTCKTEAMAHMVVTVIMTISYSLTQQIFYLAVGDRHHMK